MQGILIDPKAKTITTCEVDDKNCLQSLYILMRCSVVEQVLLGCGDVLIVDEEGKLKHPNKDGYFTIELIPRNIFAGRAVLLTEINDDWIDTGFSLEEVQGLVKWCNPTEKQVKPRAFLFSW
jgi:hypothetical protein